MRRTEGAPSARSIGLMIVLFVTTCGYALGIRWVYAALVTDDFSYLGYFYETGPWPFTVLTIFMAACVSLLMPRSIDRVSQVVLWVLFAVCVVPSMTMVDFTGYVDHRLALAVTAVTGLSFSIVVIGVRRRKAIVVTHRFPPRVVWSVIIGYSLVTYGLMTATMGLSLHLVSLTDVYDVRDEYKTQLAGAGILAYLISPQANIVNPFLIARGLIKRQWPVVAAGIVGQLLIYSASGLKSVLFSTPTVLIIALLIRNRSRLSPIAFAVGPVILMVAAALADKASASSTWTSLFSRRFLFTPGLLSSVYTRYFTDNPQAHLGQSILKWWVASPYEQAPPNLVGQFLRPDSKLIANANIFADGFANFGWWGVIGAGVGLLVYLRLLDRCSAGLPLSATAMTLIIPSITLSNAALLTAMLSHGLAVALVLLWIAPRTGWEAGKASKSSGSPAHEHRLMPVYAARRSA
jgi:hypothetical protein